MRIIGVLDLMNGRAVHARGGRRHEYAAVQQACGVRIDGDAIALARAYAGMGVGELYAADLDAIQSGAWHDRLVTPLAAMAPLWLDAGVSSAAAAERAVAAGAARVIVGLETLSSFSALAGICEAVGRERVAFSLDLRHGQPVCSVSAETLPGRIAARAAEAGAGGIIVLDLARVGAGNGPDFEIIARVRDAVPTVTLIAGGGVRHAADLARLDGAGCEGALVASALHDGRLTVADIAAAHQRQPSASR